jgi:hypothetical protein
MNDSKRKIRADLMIVLRSLERQGLIVSYWVRMDRFVGGSRKKGNTPSPAIRTIIFIRSPSARLSANERVKDRVREIQSIGANPIFR